MRHLVHVLASLAMWGLFAYYWSVVIGRGLGPGTVRAVVTLVVVVLAGLGLTVLWIAHNLRLARKFAGRRQQVPQTGDPTLARDAIGRPVDSPDLAVLQTAAVVEIEADGERKVYRVVGPEGG